MRGYSQRTGDLFPGQNPPRKVDEELEHFVVKACEVTGNHPDHLFCLKVDVICCPSRGRFSVFAHQEYSSDHQVQAAVELDVTSLPSDRFSSHV